MDNLFTPNSIPSFDYDRDLCSPGQPPYTRGIYSDMYKGKEFTMRQLTGFGSPSDTNKRIKYMLSNGATGLSILFDFPTIEMYDSDDHFSKGHIGTAGVCIDSIEDMHILFDGIDITKHSISLVTHYPTNTAILFSMFLSMASERSIPWNLLRGSVQNDLVMEEVIRCGLNFIPPSNCFRIQCDNIEFITNNLPLWNPATFNGYNLREAGTSIITESAVALSNAIWTTLELQRRGYEPSQILKRLSFFFSAGSNFFEEIARLRALRRLWYKYTKEFFDIEPSKSSLLRCHVQTSGISLTRQEPLNNIIRAAYQALASVFGGTQSLHVDSYDEAYSTPSEEAALISLRTQQIIQNETEITKVVDPLGGSYYLEYLTNKLEQEIHDKVRTITIESNGFITYIESKTIQDEINTFTYNRQKSIDNGEVTIVGLNKYTTNNQPIIPFIVPETVEQDQIERLTILKSKRDNNKVAKALTNLSSACRTPNINILPYCIVCAKLRCTEGEMATAINSSFNSWNKYNG